MAKTIDTRLFFENGRLYVSEYPVKDGKQCDFPEKVDVTEEVAKALRSALLSEEIIDMEHLQLT